MNFAKFLFQEHIFFETPLIFKKLNIETLNSKDFDSSSPIKFE